MTPRTTSNQDLRRWLPAAAAAVVLLVVVVAGGAFTSKPSDARTASEQRVVAPSSTREASLVGPSSSSVPPGTTTAVSVEPLSSEPAKGSFGEDVRKVQARLSELGFQPGPVDGQFGSLTQQAVWAFKKLANDYDWQEFRLMDDQSVVTAQTWQELATYSDPAPRRSRPGVHVEVYLPLQVLVVFKDDAAVFIAHISSGALNEDGTPATFCETAIYDTDIYGKTYDEPVEKAVCAESKTPGGIFRFKSFVAGKRKSPLGGMLNPWYFNYGIAVHGALEVPNHPASHGCVRVANDLSGAFADLISKGDEIWVWGLDGKEPEYYSEAESLPSFNRPDPSATTTSSSTSTTQAATTTAPGISSTTSQPKSGSATTLPKPAPTTTTILLPTSTTGIVNETTTLVP